MPTRAETAINRGTEAEGDLRVFYRPPLSSGKRIPQFRVQATDGGYFMEEALAGGRYWQPRAYALTRGGDGISADDIPANVWASREQRARRMAGYVAKLADSGLDLGKLNIAALASDESLDDDQREAATLYEGLVWILVWPADVVAQHLEDYSAQWAASGADVAESAED